MISLEITDIRQFTQDLFIQTVFDSFLLREAAFTTLCTYGINGRLSEGADDIQKEQSADFIVWSYVKPVCFSMIKGNRLPEQFFITLLMPKSRIPDFMEGKDTGLQPENVQSLALNIRYFQKKLTCTTGTSLSVFTLDKTLEMLWDDSIKNMLKRYL